MIHCTGCTLAIYIFGPMTYTFLGYGMYSVLDDTTDLERHYKVSLAVIWPLVFIYYVIKFIFFLIKEVVVSIYKTILDIPILTKVKKKIEESKLPTLYSSNYRVINNIKERTLPWT